MARIPRRWARALKVALIAGTIGAIACDRDQRRAARSGCVLCGVMGYAVGVGVTRGLREERRLASCGRCPEGQRCNLHYDPPRCAPTLGGEGDRCGNVGRIAYVCARGLRCALRGAHRECVALPREGQPCDYDGVQGGCAEGLLCAADDRCRRLCPECPAGMACNPLDAPPRCVTQPFPPGSRCGRFVRGDGGVHSVWYACRGACVQRDGVARCEAGDPSWRGARCASTPCPTGMRCDVVVCVPE